MRAGMAAVLLLVLLALAGCVQTPVATGKVVTPVPVRTTDIAGLVEALDAAGETPDLAERLRLANDARRLGGQASPPVQGSLDRLAASLEQGEGPGWWLHIYRRGLALDALAGSTAQTGTAGRMPIIAADGRRGLVLGSASPQALDPAAAPSLPFVFPLPQDVVVDLWRWNEQDCRMDELLPRVASSGPTGIRVDRPPPVPVDVGVAPLDPTAVRVTATTPPGAETAVLVVPGGVLRGTWLQPDVAGVHSGRVAIPPLRDGPKDVLRVIVLGGPCLVLADEVVGGLSLPG